MRLNWQALMGAIALTAMAVRAAPPIKRPDIATAKPIVACKLQSLAARPQQPVEPTGSILYTGRTVDDPLANYERTSLGDWPMAADAERSDPWLRLVLLSRKRPVVIDLAVSIDGKSFREKRESWIDDLVTATPKAHQPSAKDVSKNEVNSKSDSVGTKSVPKASEGAAPKSDKVNAEKSKPDAVPTVSAQTRQTPTMRERLATYLATNNSQVDRKEIQWLIAAWGAGPGVVLLDPSLSWQRAEISPLETFLDRNGDGTFSRDEIAHADALLRQADVDTNDVIDVSEIRRAIDHPAFGSAVSGYPLVVVLDANTDWSSLEATMATIYGKEAGEPAARSLQSRPADLSLQVNFTPNEKHPAGISILSMGPDISNSTNAVTATAEVVTFDLGGDYVEFSAAQGAAAQESDAAATQIAIGAVFDGNPLLRLLDRDNDGRLIRRERLELSGLFASLDRNGDGEVSSGEVPVPIRFAVTLGPHVHELLASPTGAARARSTKSAQPQAPAWFTSMDKNNDGDLSRGEFLGTTEQFKQLDTNSDGLLSVAEALKLKTGK